jgi:2,3-bisphosphoglycerate-independent phosphoglycerate mutase
MKKIILIVIDGLGDEPIPQLNNKTPLEAAKTPNLDFLAKNGICGLVLPWHGKGKLPTSEDTHLAIFGYNPEKFNPGRGVLEVLGIGEKIKKGDVCFRGNFATVDENLTIIDRRAERIEDTEDLIKSLNKIKIKGVKVIVRRAFGHRIGIIFRGKDLSAKVSSNDPKRVGVKVLKIKGQKRMVKVVNEFLEKARTILENHPKNKKRKKEGKLPANYILLRGAGKFKKVKSFKEKYGLKAAFIAGGTLYKGIGKYLGMEEIKVKGADGTINTNLKGKFLAAKNTIKDYDFIFLHIKACDNLAEDGKFLGKKEFIERIDQNLKPILNLKDVLIVITGDHSTCSLRKSHCNLPNPILVYGAKKDGCKKFSERECKEGKLGILKQIDLMKKISTLTKGYQKNKME